MKASNNMPVTLPIGKAIRTLRTKAGLSQGDIERDTGLLRCYLSRVENGHTMPSIETLVKLADSMKLPTSRIVAEAEVLWVEEQARQVRLSASVNITPADGGSAQLERTTLHQYSN